MQPSARAWAGRLLSFSQLRSAECENVAPGVAWVTRVVVTTPVAMPLAAASSHSDITRASRAAAQLPRGACWPIDSTPRRVFTPVAIADMVPAESGVCELVL